MKDDTTAPSMMPTRGTTSEDRKAIRRSTVMKISVPTRAAALATSICTVSPARGASRVTTSRPRAAHSVEPVVVGSTNLFWVSSCITRPEVLIAIPASTSARVRGTREAQNICAPPSADRS